MSSFYFPLRVNLRFFLIIFIFYILIKDLSYYKDTNVDMKNSNL